MAFNSDHIPAIAASIWEGAPEEVYYDMWYDDMEFMESSRNFMQSMQQEAGDGDGEFYDTMDVGTIEDANPDALEKAAYQTSIRNQQNMDLMREGFTVEEAEMRNPGTSGMMTPWGYGMNDEEVDAIMDEYPGLGSYAGTDIDEWENLDITADMVERQGGNELDSIVDSTEELATKEGSLDNVWDFFRSVGDSVGGAITQAAGFVDEATKVLIGEEGFGPTVETIRGLGQGAYEAVETLGEQEARKMESQMAVGEAITEGVGAVADVYVRAWEKQDEARAAEAAMYDIAGTALGETVQDWWQTRDLTFDPANDPGGVLGELTAVGPFGGFVPGRGTEMPTPLVGGEYPETQKKIDLLNLNVQYRDLNKGLNELGVAGMAADLGNPDNYEDYSLIEGDVENWLDALPAMGVSPEAIEALREGYANRWITIGDRATIANQGTTAGIIRAADAVAQGHMADQQARDLEMMAQIPDYRPPETTEEQPPGGEAMPSTPMGVPTDGQDIPVTVDSRDIGDANNNGIPDVLEGDGGPYGVSSGEEAEAIPGWLGPSIDTTPQELQGVDWDTQFWGEFNQLRGSGDPDAQRYIGPTLKNEVETLWYLLEGYPDDDKDAIRFAVDSVLADNLLPGNKNPLGTDALGMDPTKFVGERARGVERDYGDYVRDFFSDPSELRYGDAFYKGVEDLRESMSFYEDMPHTDRLTYWSKWNAEGAKQGLYGSRTPVDDVYAYYQFMDPTSQDAATRLSTVVAMYNTPEGSDSWFRGKQRDIYSNLYKDWIRADMSPESFLRTFVKGGKTSEHYEVEPGLAIGAGGI